MGEQNFGDFRGPEGHHSHPSFVATTANLDLQREERHQ